MQFAEELARVESAVSASACGNLSWEEWPHDYVMALGLSGQRNPLGFEAIQYLSHPSAARAMALVLILSTQMVRRGVCHSSRSNEIAWQAVEFWKDMRCSCCDGRGVELTTGRACSSCKGSGYRPISRLVAGVKDGVSMLIEAEQWMESQLRNRLKREGG
jgi:hypothetical protein